MFRYLFWLCLIRAGVGAMLWAPQQKYFDTLTRNTGLIARSIAERYFTDRTHCVALITDTTSATVAHLTKTIPLMHIRHEGNAWNPEELDGKILAALELPCLAFVVQVTDPKLVFQTLVRKGRHSSLRENRKYVFLPVLATPRDMEEHRRAPLDKILEEPEMAFMPDLIVVNLLRGNETDFEVVSLSFVGKTSWRDKVVVDIWTETEGFVYDADLFPDKIANGHGKTLTFATFNYPPYAIIDATSTPPVYDGTEVRLGREFARIHNYSWEILVDAKNEWGETWENGSGNGILGNVLMDNADLGFGALYLWFNEYQRLDFSFPYIRTGITCLAPKPRQLPGWMSPVLPFSSGMWTAVGVSMLLTTAALYGVTRASNKYLGFIKGEELNDRFTTLVDCAFRSLGLLVLQAPSSIDERSVIKSPIRHLLSWLLVVFLLVTTCYSGGLASILTVPKFESPIDTVAELAASNIRWAATHEAWVFSIKEATEPLIQHVYKQFKIMKEDDLKAIAPKGKMAFSVERLPAGHYAVGEYLTEEAIQTLRIMKQDIYWEQCVTVTRKGSPYMRSLNTLIHRLMASGVLLQWEGEVARRFLSQRVQTEVHQSGGAGGGSADPTTLQLGHVQGVFILLMFGLVLSFATFIGEVLTFKYQKRPSPGTLYTKPKVKDINPYLNQ